MSKHELSSATHDPSLLPTLSVVILTLLCRSTLSTDNVWPCVRGADIVGRHCRVSRTCSSSMTSHICFVFPPKWPWRRVQGPTVASPVHRTTWFTVPRRKSSLLCIVWQMATGHLTRLSETIMSVAWFTAMRRWQWIDDEPWRSQLTGVRQSSSPWSWPWLWNTKAWLYYIT